MTNSKGIVIFAYNSTFEYVKIANVCSALTKKFAGLPVTLITDTFGALQADRRFIDNIIIHTSDKVNNRTFRTTHDIKTKKIEWKNMTRSDIYDLTPYDQTLLLDCDYLMFNNKLLNLFDTDIEFSCHRDVYDITAMNAFQHDSRLSPYSIPLLWATVVYFRKSLFSKSVFHMMNSIKENYHYYSKVYGFRPAPFRNDFALSIAYHAMSGYGLDELIPYKLPTLSSTTDVIDFRPDGSLLYQYINADSHVCTGKVCHTDLHVMNKEIFTPRILEEMIDYATGR